MDFSSFIESPVGLSWARVPAKAPSGRFTSACPAATDAEGRDLPLPGAKESKLSAPQTITAAHQRVGQPLRVQLCQFSQHRGG